MTRTYVPQGAKMWQVKDLPERPAAYSTRGIEPSSRRCQTSALNCIATAPA
jgi:hypothetical protein